MATKSNRELDVLSVMGLKPSDISTDYVTNKTQFQLHHLVTEQRHEKTWRLSELAREDVAGAVSAVLSVDEDISAKFATIADEGYLSAAVDAMKAALKEERRIYVYGCGATGRLAKQMESSFWRPFWERMEKAMPGRVSPTLKDLMVGEMTGGDVALISSLEGLEDLQLIGELQLTDHGIQKGDVVFAVTEGGETSSVIGTILTAARMYGDKEASESAKKLFFVYNNPPTVLQSLDRLRAVLEHEGVTKIPLWTGPQAVTGSTRMQATTSEQFLLGVIAEQAIYEFLLESGFKVRELKELGFSDDSLNERLLSFVATQGAVFKAAEDLSKLTGLEAETYAKGGKATYWSDAAMVTVFTDSTERSPTFRLFPMDTVGAKEKRSWIRAVTSSEEQAAAWDYFLHRPFKGLDGPLYADAFRDRIEDPYLKEAALKSLAKAGTERQKEYDFSSAEVEPAENGIGIVAVVVNDQLTPRHRAFLKSFSGSPGGHSGVVLTATNAKDSRLKLPDLAESVVAIISPVFARDPLEVRQHVALKMALNAHSTCVMARCGRLVGNTMTSVSPSNLKLIGRATNLILMHVNDKLRASGQRVAYAQANAVLYDVIAFAEDTERTGSVAEVGAAIVRILETAASGKDVPWEKAIQILEDAGGLDSYLSSR